MSPLPTHTLPHFNSISHILFLPYAIIYIYLWLSLPEVTCSMMRLDLLFSNQARLSGELENGFCTTAVMYGWWNICHTAPLAKRLGYTDFWWQRMTLESAFRVEDKTCVIVPFWTDSQATKNTVTQTTVANRGQNGSLYTIFHSILDMNFVF